MVHVIRFPGYILAVIRAVLICLLIIIFISFYLFFSSFAFKHTPARAYRLRKAFMKLAIPILGISIEKKGEVPQETALFISNHRTLSDPFPILYFIDAYVIAKAEVADIPILNKGAVVTGIIYVKRESKDSRKATRQAMIDTLKSGLNVLVYPEGTTNGNIQTLPYRPGTFVEASKNEFPIVPVVLEYKTEYDLWYQNGIISQWFRQFWKLRTPTKISFGPIIRPTDHETMRSTAEDWSNQEIRNIHSNWDSYFGRMMKKEQA